MSTESARKFIERLKTDEGFNSKIRECHTAEERMTLAKEAGFSFTPEEIKEIRKEQLSDSELDAVAGAGCRENLFCDSLYY
ncbi:bacteriocin propeptide, TIGR03798 family [Desulfosporosinus orientis DSM 765]|uniref:Bacteriocin propeptide, TIGR03798 family n=1 Tax=Desulfosporosinus orientis (strain ATCC 19365 / DSM 765 / NCIMB 8382 / VKM B-1628 / Singapore I) TaxID=768706 RepID=G7W9B0_DESOD|nr:Nif11-like leader peptide family natural product precursor [Desulfosporosinus orientis]AET69247.1 bacteriocin propeptide, TIGR03798 family [Desulfosporosinus orientis DSM 765]